MVRLSESFFAQHDSPSRPHTATHKDRKEHTEILKALKARIAIPRVRKAPTEALKVPKGRIEILRVVPNLEVSVVALVMFSDAGNSRNEIKRIDFLCKSKGTALSWLWLISSENGWRVALGSVEQRFVPPNESLSLHNKAHCQGLKGHT